LNPDAVPADEIRKRYEARERGEQRKVRIFGYVLFVLFLLLSAAFTGFLIWAYCETT
jgi:nitrate reductase NapE component